MTALKDYKKLNDKFWKYSDNIFNVIFMQFENASAIYFEVWNTFETYLIELYRLLYCLFWNR